MLRSQSNKAKQQEENTPESLDRTYSADTPPVPFQVFVNRNLRMDTVKAIGFDMDYTLARYRREKLEELAHRLTINKLIQRGYPESIKEIKYEREFVIRGLTVDKQLGNILKMDRHGHVARVFHGRTQLTKKQRREMYRRERLHFIPPRFAVVDTLFSLPEMCLYAELIDFLTAMNGKGKVDTWQLFDDTRECIDEAHRDNTLKSIVRQDLETYVERDPLLGRTLHKLRSSGKKLFVLTNSYWPYTNDVMSYLLNGALPEYPNWQSYFELTIVGAQKPRFFTDSEPMAELDEHGQILHRPANPRSRGRIFQGGNLVDFEKFVRLSGEDILYVGDHIYGDILRSKKHSLWRTALIVEELEDELQTSMGLSREMEHLASLERERRNLDDLANAQRRSLSQQDKELGPRASNSPEYLALRKQRNATKARLKRVLSKMARLSSVLDKSFNPNWGMVFKEDGENSRFGEQVADYACLYTSRVTNFLHYSAYQYFRSPRDLLPHEQMLLHPGDHPPALP